MSFTFTFAYTGGDAEAATRRAKKPSASSKHRTARPRYSARTARARRLKLARARAALAAAALREAATPRFKIDEHGDMVPDLRAAAAIIYNPETHEILWEENAQNARSIASITKVMTALVFLEDDPDLHAEVTIERADVRAASVTYLSAGERIRVGELLHLLLIASDNGAARALARVSTRGSDGFVDRMMEKASELDLETAYFADPSGLNPANVASAFDISKLISSAAADERIASIMRTPQYTLTTSRRTFTVHSTNKLLLGGDVNVMGGKTGFIGKAGYCLATLLKLPQGGPPLAVVVLGARSSAGRFWETRHLLNWMSTKAAAVALGAPPQPQPQH